MMMREDGSFGCPGGLIDEGETEIEALNREFVEEINAKIDFCEKDKLNTQFIPKKNILLHFYAKEIPQKTFEDIEKNVHQAMHFGTEVIK